MNRKMRSTRPASWKLRYYFSFLNGETLKGENSLFSTILVTELWQTGKALLSLCHAIREDHEETTDDREVAQEECHIENETVSETLDDDDAQQACDGIFCVFLEDDCWRTRKHGLHN
jgi:hypothetical protein